MYDSPMTIENVAHRLRMCANDIRRVAANCPALPDSVIEALESAAVTCQVVADTTQSGYWLDSPPMINEPDDPIMQRLEQ